MRCDRVAVESPTSQYLSSLLLAAPLADTAARRYGGGRSDATEIEVLLLNERPYVDMSLWWLDSQNIAYERNGYEWFRIPGGQSYQAFDTRIPADFSSATFLACAAAVTGSRLHLLGLDMDDPQGDKAVLDILARMGCTVEHAENRVTVSGPPDAFDAASGHAIASLRGGSFDLNAVPDALPALAATACYAVEPVALVNVPQARAKETDRVAVMAAELSKMGARVEERRDGLVVHPAREKAEDARAGKPVLQGTEVHGHADHRVVMALAVAALGAAGRSRIDTAEAAAVTFPGFFELIESLRPDAEGAGPEDRGR